MQCFGLTIRQNKLHSRESNAEAKILPRHFIFIRLYMLKIVVMSCAQVLTRVVRRYRSAYGNWLRHGQGRPRPWTPAGGGSAPRPLRSCGAEVGGGRGVGRSRGCKGCKGCFSGGCEWLGLGNRLWRFPKGFWGMVGYRREIGWGTCKVAGNRSVPGGGGGVWRPGGLRPPGQPNQSRGRAALRAALPLLCARFARPPPPRGTATSSIFPRAFPPRNRPQQAGRGWDKPGGSEAQLTQPA